MNVSFNDFERELSVVISGLKPEMINKELAAFARRVVAEEIRAGRASATYDLYVNNRPALSEDSVKAPGPILYVFSNWGEVIEAALLELQKFSPKKSGRYAGSFIVIVNGRVIRDYTDIPPNAEVIIMNHRPYTRKMETSANRTGARHFQRASSAIDRRFRPHFTCGMLYLKPGSGLHPDVPYILKGSSGRRKDRQAGQPITYPALSIQAG